MKKEYWGIAGLFSVTIMWGGGFIASDFALAVLTPVQIMSARFFLATICMLIVAHKNILTITKQELKAGIVLGICLFSAFMLQTIGLKFSTPSKNAFLTATNVIFVPLIVWAVSRKRPKMHEICGMLLAFIGAGILSLEHDFSIGIGELLSLLCAFFFACQLFFTGLYAPRLKADVLNFVQMATAFIMSFIFLPFSGGIPVVCNKSGILSLLYLGVISTTLTYFLQTVSQRCVKQVQAVIILSLEAVFAAVFSVLFIHEQISLRIICASILILSAVLVSEIKLKRKTNCDNMK